MTKGNPIYANLTKIAILALAVVATPVAVNAERVQIEAEDFTTCQDIASEPIRKVEAPACSGGFMLAGLDYADEWAEYELTIASLGIWAPTMKCRGDQTLKYTLRLTFTGTQSGKSHSIDMVYYGQGYL
ncbi:MAG: hypothetical protein KAJ17_04220 [Candidatus Krumholzibacteria bacterium]|nr:hypothetical protein [Candidatus Krumholzibacteria bacterium]